ncbi:MAG: oleate hydratase [Paracoccaceae bacterium]
MIDIDFNLSADRKTATLLHVVDKSRTISEIAIGANDCVFLTNGSITESTDLGSWDRAAVLKGKSDSGSWLLWEKIAKKDASFGNPGVFCDAIELQEWYSFTATMKDATFHDHMENFSGNVDGTGGLVTLTDSNWLMSFVIARQPHFPNQPKDVKVFWGYGLYPNRMGNFIKKKMADCTGQEMLQELWYHLKLQDMMTPIMQSGKINCIPVAMPFIDSLFMPRSLGDRPFVLPKGTTNFAFLGQFAEVNKDCVFTVEYSVRCAMEAVYGLFETGKKVLPVYDSIHQPSVLMQAAQALTR